MAREVVNYTGESLRTTYHFTGRRDAEVARQTAIALEGNYQFGGDITTDQLMHPAILDPRVVLLRESISLSNEDAARAGLIPPTFANSSRLLMPQSAFEEGVELPFIGAFLPPSQLEIATKLSIHEISPATQATVSARLQNVQEFGTALNAASTHPVLDGWTAVDTPGADFAAQHLLALGGNVIIKYGRGSLGQDQWTFHDETSYREAMQQMEDVMNQRGANWQESGLVFERKLAIHDQFVVGQLNFKGQLVSWIGTMDHTPIINADGNRETMYTGSSKLFVLGGIEQLMALPLPQEAIEDLGKAREFGEIMEAQVKGGAITRVHYNLIRGKVETEDPNGTEQYISGITEVTLRGGGGSGAEVRVNKALARDTTIFRRTADRDASLVTVENSVPSVIGLTRLEFYPTDEEYQNAPQLSASAEVLYDGTDPTYGHVRIYTDLDSASTLLHDQDALKRFLYPNTSAQQLSN